MRFGILTPWYDPEPGPASLPGVLTRGLSKRGHDVQVVTGFPNYPVGKFALGYRIRWCADELRDGVRVRRVALYPSHDRSIARRMLNYTSLAASALGWGISALREVDATPRRLLPASASAAGSADPGWCSSEAPAGGTTCAPSPDVGIDRIERLLLDVATGKEATCAA